MSVSIHDWKSHMKVMFCLVSEISQGQKFFLRERLGLDANKQKINAYAQTVFISSCFHLFIVLYRDDGISICVWRACLERKISVINQLRGSKFMQSKIINREIVSYKSSVTNPLCLIFAILCKHLYLFIINVRKGQAHVWRINADQLLDQERIHNFRKSEFYYKSFHMVTSEE